MVHEQIINEYRDSKGNGLDDYWQISEQVPQRLDFSDDLSKYVDDARLAFDKALKDDHDNGCPKSKEKTLQAAKGRASIEAASNLHVALQSLVRAFSGLIEHGKEVLMAGKAPTKHVMSLNIVDAQVSMLHYHWIDLDHNF